MHIYIYFLHQLIERNDLDTNDLDNNKKIECMKWFESVD